MLVTHEVGRYNLRIEEGPLENLIPFNNPMGNIIMFLPKMHTAGRNAFRKPSSVFKHLSTELPFWDAPSPAPSHKSVDHCHKNGVNYFINLTI